MSKFLSSVMLSPLGIYLRVVQTVYFQFLEERAL